MKFTRIVLLFLSIFWLSPAWATVGVKAFVDDEGLEYWVGVSTDTKPTATTLPVWSVFFETDTKQQYRIDDTGTWVTFATPVYDTALSAGEDQTNDVTKVEQRFSYCVDDADKACKASAGFVYAIRCWPEDAAAEAGRVRLLDSTAAGAGTEVWGDEFAAAAYSPNGMVLNSNFSTGIFIDFTTTTDVFCTVTYR